MIKIKLYIIAIVVMMIPLCSCHDEVEYKNDAYGNFDALWSIIDEHYCFFDYKSVDWDAVRTKYRARVSPNMSNQELFSLLGEMLAELKDGHTNLISPFNVSRYWKWFEDYPQNFDERLVLQYYLNFEYASASGIKYKVLPNNYGYMYYGSFESSIGYGNLDYALAELSTCDGLVIDVRDNGGGALSNVEKIVSRFITERTLAGYIQHKDGPGHNDMSEPYAYYINPAGAGHILFAKPVVVLTNRSTYSAANNFVSIMKSLPQVRIVGDRTGGGSGLPFTLEIPNGWTIRFSACPITDANGNDTEYGVDPSEGCKVDLDQNLASSGVDTMLEKAFSVLKQMQKAEK